MAAVPGFVLSKGASTTSTTTSPIEPERPPSATGTATVPPLPPLHLAAQTGDLNTLNKVLGRFASSEGLPGNIAADLEPPVTANDRDPQGITALHWAAINNHLLACKILLDSGAEVDATGGDLQATPMHWAARNGHVYIVHLLLKHNADPTLLDSQCFNTLHLAVHSSSALLLAYLLFTSQPIAVDSADTEGHTALHWACYQGDAISVDLLLRAGASPTRADEAGLTPLHWAAVKGNSACIKRVVEAGVDMTAREKQGKTAKDMATELKSIAAYKRGLFDAGYDEDGRPELEALSPQQRNIAIFVIPLAGFCLIGYSLAILPWWSGVLLSCAEAFGMHHIISRVLLNIRGDQNNDRLTRSPYLCSVIVASLFWCTWIWATRFVRDMPGYSASSLLCGICVLVCSYNFFRAITLDPGHISLSSNDLLLKETIEELVESGSFNGMNFCLQCLIRRPLRSKHSHSTKRCIARFDHYCPWVWNDVGVNNHRQFVLFVTFLVVSVVAYIHLAIGYFSKNSVAFPLQDLCGLPSSVCAAARFDMIALVAVLWATLQLTWTSILLCAQFWQICRQMTTLEVTNVGRYGFMGGRPGTSATGQEGFVEKWNAGRAMTGEAESHVHGPGCDHGTVPTKKKKGRGNFLLKILGIDRFTEGKAAEGLAKSGHVTNPFDLGLLSNCKDFWSRGRELGVDYTRLHDVPDGGFRRAVKDRRRREKEDRDIRVSKGGQISSRYERVAMNDMDEV